MKKLLSTIGAISLLTSGIVTTISGTSAINTTNSNINNNIEQNSGKYNIKVLEENLDNLKKINQKLIIDSLVQKGNNVILNYKLFLSYNLTDEFINLIKNYQFENTNIKTVEKLWFTKQTSQISVYSFKEWRVAGQAPRVWYEWIAGVWRLEFNHRLIQDIVYGAVTLADLIGIVGDAGLYAAPAVVASAILTFTGIALDNADLGNGVLFRFAAWIIPTQVTNSTHNWN